jgi:hypothetical protein
VLVYSLANFVIQSLVQPVFVGDAVGLSVTLTFLSVIVWTVVMGPLGAVLAIPLTLLAHAVLVGQDPERRWARALLAGTAAAPSNGPDPGPDPARRRPVRRPRTARRLPRRPVVPRRSSPLDDALPAGRQARSDPPAAARGSPRASGQHES